MRRRTRAAQAAPESPAAIDLSGVTPPLLVASRSLAAIALALSAARKGTDTQKIRFLQSLGLDRHEIAGILVTTPQVVSTLLSRLRRSRRR